MTEQTTQPDSDGLDEYTNCGMTAEQAAALDADPFHKSDGLAAMKQHIRQYDTPKVDDPRRRYTEAQFETAVSLAALSSTSANKDRQVIELPMVAFSERSPVRDEMMGEQTILTYSENTATWNIETYESQWEFPDRWLGSTHWLDITEMWPGVTAQVTSFRQAIGEAQ